MTKIYCDRCNREMSKPLEATDNSCRYFQYVRTGNIEIHLAYRVLPFVVHQDVCPWCLVAILQEELGVAPVAPKRRIE